MNELNPTVGFDTRPSFADHGMAPLTKMQKKQKCNSLLEPKWVIWVLVIVQFFYDNRHRCVVIRDGTFTKVLKTSE